jgi:DMSO/TMAO reductase YedYZ molybdopterin-dependent catalytic subunit
LAHDGAVLRLRRFELGAVIGLLCAGTAVGVGELVAAFVRPEASPIIAVGNRFVILTPEVIRRWAIREFGSNDKSVLLSGIYVAIAVLAVGLGVLALRKLWFGLAGLAFFGAVGVYSALTAHASRTTDAVPTIVATGAAMVMLQLLNESAIGSPSKGNASATMPDRRRFLLGGAGALTLAFVGGFGGRALQHVRFDAGRARAAVTLPPAAAPPDVSGVDLGKGGVPWATPSSSFYRVDTALAVPQIDPDTWTLRIHGMVDKEISLTYKDVLARTQIERWITLTCVSNEVGGDLIGNALFQGTLLADVLREAGIQEGADQLVMTSSDGMTIGAPVAAVMDGRDALLAVGMNRAPLPVEHGFPVRVVVPGLYGYVSACKWVVDINVTTFARFDAYWVVQGWVQQAPILLSSRIDKPRSGGSVQVGRPTVIAGVAWEQRVGVKAVEVQIDNGAWQPTRLAGDDSIDTWRQWVFAWTPTQAGSVTVKVRATDMNGKLQDAADREPYPGASTGYHTVNVTVRQ